MRDDRLEAIDVLAIVLVMALAYVWFRFTAKAAEKVVPTAMRLVRPTIRSVIERAEQITREAVETAGKEGIE
jgi:hypothetical protein